MRRGVFFKNPLFYKDRQLCFDTRFSPDKGNYQAKPHNRRGLCRRDQQKGYSFSYSAGHAYQINLRRCF